MPPTRRGDVYKRQVYPGGISITSSFSPLKVYSITSVSYTHLDVYKRQVDEIVRHEGSLYKVVQAHTSQSDWAPPDVPALFAKIIPPGLIAEWVQPTGAQDTYSLGDLVTHVGKTWESTVDNNSWEPGVYGWVEVE